MKVDHWRDGESTRAAARVAITNFLWKERTGLPIAAYGEQGGRGKVDAVVPPLGTGLKRYLFGHNAERLRKAHWSRDIFQKISKKDRLFLLHCDGDSLMKISFSML